MSSAFQASARDAKLDDGIEVQLDRTTPIALIARMRGATGGRRLTFGADD